MEENQKTQEVSYGLIEIAPEVIENIAGIVAGKIDGFYPISGRFKAGFNSILGREELAKGTYLTEQDGAYIIDVYGNIDYGKSVPKVALLLQEKIKEQLLFSCELEIAQVNVHIQSIVPAKSDEPALLELEEEE